MTNRWAALFLLSGSLAFAGDSGFAPRPSPTDYPIRQAFSGGTVAAARLTDSQVKRSFAADISQAYVVVEVALYPQPGTVLSLDAYDFALQIGSVDTERPVSPEAVVASLNRDRQSPSVTPPVAVYPSVGVVHESGGPYGPGGWGTYSGVGVAIGGGPSSPAPPQRDPRADEDELNRKSVPSGQFDVPMAGYLYFPKPGKKQKDQHLTVEYDPGSGSPVLLPLPTAP